MASRKSGDELARELKRMAADEVAADISAQAESVVCDLPENVRDMARELAENVIWMQGRLADARRFIGSTQVVMAYDNGGGQKGFRKNPAYDGYNSLMKSYTSAMKQLCEMLGRTEPTTEDEELDELIEAAPTARPRRTG